MVITKALSWIVCLMIVGFLTNTNPVMAETYDASEGRYADITVAIFDSDPLTNCKGAVVLKEKRLVKVLMRDGTIYLIPVENVQWIKFTPK